MNKTIWILLLAGFALGGCDKPGAATNPSGPGGRPVGPAAETDSLVDARKGFKTKLVPSGDDKTPPARPPAKIFQLVKYDAAPGKMSAYLSPDPNDGKKHPAIVWITGGDCNSIDEGCWNEGPPSDDQSAGAYRKAGIIMMFPSLRGGNNNPGQKEGFLGEVDDVLAAAKFLAAQKYVDPNRIYLGGHSTGGTLVLLVSECSDRFRAVFSFGPANDMNGYPPQFTPFDRANPKEGRLRSPGYWLSSIKSPTFVIEGTVEGNINALQAMSRTSTNPKVRFIPVAGASHFSVLSPMNRLISDKILKDDGATCNIDITDAEVRKAGFR